MGSLGDLLGMIPGLKKVAGQADSEEAKRELVRIQAIIDSMTMQERDNHLVLNGQAPRAHRRPAAEPPFRRSTASSSNSSRPAR